jgi:hypothetical protein
MASPPRLPRILECPPAPARPNAYNNSFSFVSPTSTADLVVMHELKGQLPDQLNKLMEAISSKDFGYYHGVRGLIEDDNHYIVVQPNNGGWAYAAGVHSTLYEKLKPFFKNSDNIVTIIVM